MASRQRTYWVVSPNVKNDNRSVGEWRQASVTTRAAFMGWDPDDPGHGQMGPKLVRPGRVNVSAILLGSMQRSNGGLQYLADFARITKLTKSVSNKQPRTCSFRTAGSTPAARSCRAKRCLALAHS